MRLTQKINTNKSNTPEEAAFCNPPVLRGPEATLKDPASSSKRCHFGNKEEIATTITPTSD